MTYLLTLNQLQRIKQWHVAHKDEHPLEYELWDLMLCLWVMGWIGCLPAFALDIDWAYPLCALAILAPGFYMAWRSRAHQAMRLRCDWLLESS
jgi:hypothetical protein